MDSEPIGHGFHGGQDIVPDLFPNPRIDASDLSQFDFVLWDNPAVLAGMNHKVDINAPRGGGHAPAFIEVIGNIDIQVFVQGFGRHRAQSINRGNGFHPDSKVKAAIDRGATSP